MNFGHRSIVACWITWTRMLIIWRSWVGEWSSLRRLWPSLHEAAVPGCDGSGIMALARFFRKVCLFITSTCNPNWPEIQQELLRDADGRLLQNAFDRPDLVARVFQLKVRHLLHLVWDKETPAGCVHTLGFQKPGLPHMHDSYIQAEPSGSSCRSMSYQHILQVRLPVATTNRSEL